MSLFPIYQDLQAAVIFNNDEGIKERDNSIWLFLMREFDASCIINCIEVVGQLLYAASLDTFKDVIDVTFPKSRFASQGCWCNSPLFLVQLVSP